MADSNDFNRLPQCLSLDGNVSENWKKFYQEFQIYMTSTEKNTKPEDVKVAVFLRCAGYEALDIYNSFDFPTDADKTLENVVDKFKAYCEPKTNVTYERYVFFNRCQAADEPIDSFVTNLKKLAGTCEFAALKDSLVKDRIVMGIRDDCLRSKLLKHGKLTLETAVDMCRAQEFTSNQMKRINEKSAVHVNTVKNYASSGTNYAMRGSNASSGSNYAMRGSPRPCQFCGYNHKYGRDRCPASGKRCNNCSSIGHFASCCKRDRNTARTVRQLYVDEPEEYDVGTVMDSMCKFVGGIPIKISDKVVYFQPDTGSDVTIISLELAKLLNVKGFTKTRAILCAFGGFKIQPLGTCILKCFYEGSKYDLQFFVVEHPCQPILSNIHCQKLGILKFTNTLKNDPLIEYSDVFNGIGCLAGEVHFEVRDDAVPVQHAPRKIPIALREKVKNELDSMVKAGIIVKEDKPTSWVNSMVCVENSKGKLRLCIDPRDLNKALKRQHFPMSTIEDITTRLSRAKIFTVLDAARGFWQLKLDEPSSKMCTFNSPFGRYRFLRLPFGVSVAPEVYQAKMTELFGDIQGVEIMMDDLLIWGENEEQHDCRLKSVLDVCRERNLKLNRSKLAYKTKAVKYIGHILTESGIKPDPDKVKAIQEMPPPQNKAGISTFLGMVNYLCKFLPHLSSLTKPLREVLRKESLFIWDEQLQSCFDLIKNTLSNDATLSYFDVSKEVTLSADASKDGLGACLTQNSKPIAYASKSLTDTQKRYAQIEKECLAIYFAAEKFHTFIYGRPVTVETDHKPLVNIFCKPLSDAPPRLQRMLLQLQKYQLNVTYKPGKDLYVADALSRAFLSEQKDDKIQVINVSKVLLEDFNAQLMREIVESTAVDEELKILKETILKGWPETRSQCHEATRPYWNYRELLSVLDGLILKDRRIVVPRKLRSEMLRRLHTSHLGIEKTLSLARDLVFWPAMTDSIKQKIESCDICNSFLRKNAKEPLTPHPCPLYPWQKVGADLFEYAGNFYIILVDYFSRIFEFGRLSQITSLEVIKFCKDQFSRYGIPEVLHSDNGTQFTSRAFRQFSLEYNFLITTSSPEYPQSNGMAERTIQTVKNLLRKSSRGGEDLQLALLNLRNSKVYDIASPAQLMFGRRTRTNIPTARSLLTASQNQDINERFEEQQQKQKMYYDVHSKKLPTLQNGDIIRFRPRRNDDWRQGVVLGENLQNSYDIEDQQGRVLRRNRRDLKRRNETLRTAEVQEDEDPDCNPLEKNEPNIEKDSPVENNNAASQEAGLRYSSRGRLLKKPDRLGYDS